MRKSRPARRSYTDVDLLPIVDDNDVPIGSRPRAEVHALGLKHRGVHIVVHRGNDQVLLQRRSMAKDRYPGWWDVSVGGHVDPGEDYLTAAVREAREELGLEEPELRLVCRRPASKLTGQEFVAVYAHRLQGNPAANAQEICALAWVPVGELFVRKPNGAPMWRVTGSGLESLRLWGVWAGWLR